MTVFVLVWNLDHRRGPFGLVTLRLLKKKAAEKRARKAEARGKM